MKNMNISKKVVVDAYFMNNVGDDLFLELLVSRYPNVYFDFVTPNLEYVKYFKNNSRVATTSSRDMLKNVKQYDAHITIGGSMFQQPPTWKKLWVIYFLKIFIFKFNKKKTVLIGCNFGPFKSKLYLFMYQLLFKKIDFISVRDQMTKKLIGHQKGNVFNYPDIVFSMDSKKYFSIPKSKIIGISVMDFGDDTKYNNYQADLTSLINELAKTNSVRLFSFQDTDAVSDKKVIDLILENIDFKENIEVVNYDGNLDIFTEKYGECVSFLTTRYHSLILSIIANQNIVALNYNMKVKNTINSLNLSVSLFNIEEMKQFSNEIIHLLLDDEKDNLNTALYERNLKKAAIKHFSYLDTILGG